MVSLFYFLFLIFWTTTAEDGCRERAPVFPRNYPAPDPSSKFPCHCLNGNEIAQCACDESSLDNLNSQIVKPQLASVLQRTFFRYFKVNLNKDCPFWNDDGRCSIRDCAVKTCSSDELPASLRNGESSAKTVEQKFQEACAQEEKLSSVDTTLNAAQRADVGKWDTKHGDDNFCVLEDEFAQDCDYIDLAKNPERYTGYMGPHANRVWKTIYEENCFKPSDPYSPDNLALAMMYESCLEKRTFFRLISGLHSSISIHLCAEYLHPNGRWGPNVAEFLRRFDDAKTNNEGRHRLSNLYFTYAVVLRAISKAESRLRNEKYFTGDRLEDEVLRATIGKLLDSIRIAPHQFDETKLFCGEPAEALRLKEEFRVHFRNISQIMDCVGCEKCRLWGKLQTQGIGTALKLLFSDHQTIEDIKLKRSEVVSLWNAFGRLSSSLVNMQRFRDLLRNPSLDNNLGGGGDAASAWFSKGKSSFRSEL